MAYIGIGPASFTNNLTNVQILDDISSGFNGTEDDFQLASNSIPFQAVSDRALMVILGGVIQAPGVDYTINGTQITFTTPPVSGLTFYARNIYGLNALNGVNDGIVVPASLSTGGPSWDTSGNTTISGNLTVQGATTTIQSTTLDVIDKDIKLASNQSTNAGIDTAGLLWGTTAVKLKYYNNGGTNPGLNIEGTNVGIGTTAPTEKLHVTGTIKVGPNDTATRSGSVKIGGAGVLSYSDNHGSSGNVATVVLENSYGAANSDIHVKQRGDFEVQNLAGHAILRVDTAWTNSSVNSGNVYLNYKSGASGSSVETKLETTSTGVTITGTPIISTLTASRVPYVGSSKELVDSASFTFNGSTATINGNSTDTPLILDTTSANGSHMRFQKDAGNKHFVGSGGGFGLGDIDDLAFRTVDNLIFGVGTSEKLRIDASGHVTPGAAGTQDLGSTSKEFRHLYLGDSGKVQLGLDQDFTLWHNNSHGLIKNTTGRLYLLSDDLWIKNEADNKTSARFFEGNEVFLYHNDTVRLTTTSTGITVSGEVAASQDYPTIRPIIDFNFAAVKQLDPRITYYRNGTASYIDENGIVKFAPPNEPRFDHNPVTKESRGFLIEESKTNNNRVAGQEWKVETATGWAQNNWKKEHYPSETAPDGLTNTTLMYPNTDNDTHYSYINHAGNSYTGRRTISCWFKNLSSTIYYPQLRIFGAGSGKAHAVFTLTGNGSVTSGGNAKEAATITPYPNGWYRCTLSWSYNSGHYGGGIVITNDSSTELPSFTGNSDKTKGFLAWGFQDETGGSNGNFPTSFIPSDGAAAPADTMITPGRGADYAFIEDQHFTDLYNVAEGTFLVKGSVDDLTTSNQPMWGVEKSSNRSGYFNVIGYRVGGGSSGYTAAWYNNNGSTSAFVNINTGVTVGTPFVTAFGYKLNDMAASTDGSTPSTDTSASITNDGEYNRFTLGSYHYDAMSVGHIQRAVYYRQRLTNTQLKNITS
jgi:hypothetical protein